MTPKEQAKADQDFTAVGEMLPSLWWRMYRNCIKEGFQPGQALDLVKTFILSTGGGQQRVD